MKTRNLCIISVFTFLIPFVVLAYVPNSQFIFSKVASLHGQGSYIIEQEVEFVVGTERLPVKEQWIVVDGGEMRLQVMNDNISLTKIYRKGRVFWNDQKNNERSLEMPVDFFMPALLTRNSNELKKIFLRWNILTAEAFKEKRPPRDVKDIKYEPEKFVRLARVDGGVMYAFGQPSPVEGPLQPGLWVEQDVFNIRKIRTPSGAEYNGGQFSNFSKNLSFPKFQSLSFDGNSVSVRLTKVQSVGLTNEQKKNMDPVSLRAQKQFGARFPAGPMGRVVEAFYTRMR